MHARPAVGDADDARGAVRRLGADHAVVVAAHRASGHEATLVLAPGRPGYTGIAVADGGRVVGIGGPGDPDGPRPFRFTGIHVLDEALLDRIPPDRPSDIVRDVYLDAMRAGRLGSWIHRGFWWEFGTPTSYLEGSLRLVRMDADDRLRIARTDPVRPFGEGTAAVGPGADFHGRKKAQKVKDVIVGR